MKRVLWLSSWYPNKNAPFDGDFIQRMAWATALYEQVFVIAVVPGQPAHYTDELVDSGSYTEWIIYQPVSNGLFGKIFSQARYIRLFRKSLKTYISKYGKPDLVHVQIPMKAGLMALWLNSTYKIPYVVTEHYGIYNDVVEDKFSNRSVIFRKLTQEVIRRASLFLPVSRMLGEAINKLVTKKDFIVIPNTVDTSLFYYKENSPTDYFRFIHVSNMIPLKNPKGIIDACKELNSHNINFQFTFIGPYPDLVYEYARNSELLNRSIFFTGEISYHQVAVEMQKADSLVLFSNIENMPCVVLEALCCGLPVLATRVGGIPEVINKENGILVGPGNFQDLTIAMKEIIHSYKKYNQVQISEEAKRLYSYKMIGKKISEAYDAVQTVRISGT